MKNAESYNAKITEFGDKISLTKNRDPRDPKNHYYNPYVRIKQDVELSENDNSIVNNFMFIMTLLQEADQSNLITTADILKTGLKFGISKSPCEKAIKGLKAANILLPQSTTGLHKINPEFRVFNVSYDQYMELVNDIGEEMISLKRKNKR